MILARWRKFRSRPVATRLQPWEPRTWLVVARLEARTENGERLILDPPMALTYEDRTSGRDWWNTRETRGTSHVFSMPDGRRVHFLETWDENDEGVMVLTTAFPPVGLEVVPTDRDAVGGSDTVGSGQAAFTGGHPNALEAATIDFDAEPYYGLLPRQSMKTVPDGASIVSIDILHFRERVNDVFGHTFGDLVIKTLSDRLRTDLTPYRVFRSAGDEFVIEVPEGLDEPTAITIAERIAGIVSEPIEGMSDPLESRIGICIDRVRDGDVEAVWFVAEQAAYEAAVANEPYKISR